MKKRSAVLCHLTTLACLLFGHMTVSSSDRAFVANSSQVHGWGVQQSLPATLILTLDVSHAYFGEKPGTDVPELNLHMWVKRVEKMLK